MSLSTAPQTVPEVQAFDAAATYVRLRRNIEQVLRGQAASIRRVLAAYVAGGHVLLEDVPGTGKTTLAKALARSVEAEFQRIQFTPDLLPADILGVSVYEREAEAFRFHPGPLFTDILLADEINRASPRTQSALLEAMAEGQVSLDGARRPLGETFFVMATQNPVEFEGTYPLPESQMDRFALRLGLGYVDPEEEVAILSERTRADPLDAIGRCATKDDVLALRRTAQAVRVSEELKHYIVALVGRTRAAEGVRVGASPRASLAVLKVAQCLALFDAQPFVTPEHVQEVAVDVIAHRLVLHPEARYAGASGAGLVQEALREVPVPA